MAEDRTASLRENKFGRFKTLEYLNGGQRSKGKIKLRRCGVARENNLEDLKLYINECHYLKQPI